MIRIRPAQTKDIALIEDLIEAGYRREEAREGWAHETDAFGGDRLSAGEIARDLNASDHHFIVAVDADDLALGVICISKLADRFEIGRYSVRPRLQNQGIGKQLLHAAEAFAKDHWEAKAMHLTVLVFRHALIAYYERHGYQDTGERLDFLTLHPYVSVKNPNLDLKLAVLKKEL